MFRYRPCRIHNTVSWLKNVKINKTALKRFGDYSNDADLPRVTDMHRCLYWSSGHPAVHSAVVPSLRTKEIDSQKESRSPAVPNAEPTHFDADNTVRVLPSTDHQSRMKLRADDEQKLWDRMLLVANLGSEDLVIVVIGLFHRWCPALSVCSSITLSTKLFRSRDQRKTPTCSDDTRRRPYK